MSTKCVAAWSSRAVTSHPPPMVASAIAQSHLYGAIWSRGKPLQCSLCDASLGPIIAEGVQWRLVLNHNQNLLGKCFVATRRHVEEVSRLREDEWRELHQQLAAATDALTLAFAPDHFNYVYVFLQNQDRHVHMHVIPRYARARTFAGSTFDDPGYPGHYRIDDPPRRLSADDEAKLAQQLSHLIGQSSGTDRQ